MLYSNIAIMKPEVTVSKKKNIRKQFIILYSISLTLSPLFSVKENEAYFFLKYFPRPLRLFV